MGEPKRLSKGLTNMSGNSVDGRCPDFVLKGPEFEGLRKAVDRIIGAKRVMEKVITRTPRVPEGPVANLSEKRFHDLCTEIKGFDKQQWHVCGTLAGACAQFENELKEVKSVGRWVGVGVRVQEDKVQRCDSGACICEAVGVRVPVVKEDSFRIHLAIIGKLVGKTALALEHRRSDIVNLL
uniref:Uncharacterized protein n=1 Tax=Chromera velia CCMP2878 TaxID=1169474 RepID=A0A0G4HP14_9ALVE|eukprot:Cvel_7761.t1-p1 / transcript=Cvel_7761.t1 / gene=Cvel_7761 / organism=Chromera_velia_CCMP2878 / gene_product=hypothetical protein / transcript_product=hypothetical protein / location=Cvel_scaffold413:60576-66024(+) / protein_length=180 / sequence_SO=supercontig / SO=protein_coding / is_pseudo=false